MGAFMSIYPQIISLILVRAPEMLCIEVSKVYGLYCHVLQPPMSSFMDALLEYKLHEHMNVDFLTCLVFSLTSHLRHAARTCIFRGTHSGNVAIS